MNTSIDQHLGQCEPGLLFWLVEELLDTQTIDGCGIIFDYLDSRRERITAVSHHRIVMTDIRLIAVRLEETLRSKAAYHPEGLQ